MVKVSNWKRLGIGVLALTVIVALGYIWRSCNEASERRISELQGRYDALAAEASAEKKEAERIIQAKETEIAELDVRLQEKESVMSGMNEKLQAKQAEIVELADQFETLTTTEAKLVNMTRQRDTWKDKFSLAIKERDKALEMVGIWKLKYESQAEISNQLKIQLANETRLLEVSRELNVQQGRQIKRMKFKFTLKTIFYNAASFGLGYILGDG